MTSQDNQTTVRLHKMKEGSTNYRWDLVLNEVEIDAVDDEGAPVRTLCVFTTKVIQFKGEPYRGQNKALTQCEKDANWILDLLKKEGGTLSLKQLHQFVLSEIGQVKNATVRIGRARDKLCERELIVSEKTESGVVISLLSHESAIAA